MPKTDSPQELGRIGSSRAWNEAAHALAVQVHQARGQRHMSSLALAEQCRLSGRIIEDIECGHPVEQSAVEAVCRTLGLPILMLDGDPVHTFALLIRQRREQARLRQYQLAALSGLAAKTIKEVERAARWPKPETCVALLSVTALHLQLQDIAGFVTDLNAASDLPQRIRQLAEARISAAPELIARTHRPDSDQDEPDQVPDRPPNPMKPRARLLFALRVYVDGSIVFTPSMKAQPK